MRGLTPRRFSCIPHLDVVLALSCATAWLYACGTEPTEREALVDAGQSSDSPDARALAPDPDAARPNADAAPGDPDAALPLATLEDGELRPGGATTTDVLGVGAFVQQAANLTLARRADFESGLQFFQLPWEVAPGRAEADGLGPLFLAASCLGCHARNGRGVPGVDGAAPGVGVLLRLGLGDDGSPDPVYGDQLQTFGIPGVPGEAHVERTDLAVVHALADGTQQMLVQPRYDLVDLAYGPVGADLRVSPRLAQQLVGQGLLEAVTEADVLEWADPDDADADGISGRAARLADGTLGRFGWKASQPSVEAQAAAAFRGDLGITVPSHPDQSCTSVQTACTAATTGGSPEINAVRLAATSSYLRLLGVPARRDGDSSEVRTGKALFGAIGCASCHRPSFVTASTVIEQELASQRIWPYGDGLVHDLGPELADRRPEGGATGSEWRTAPLWGLGLVALVNGQLALLHDGRARTIDEAILWHAGEAEAARVAYELLPASSRALVVRFVESL